MAEAAAAVVLGGSKSNAGAAEQYQSNKLTRTSLQGEALRQGAVGAGRRHADGGSPFN